MLCYKSLETPFSASNVDSFRNISGLRLESAFAQTASPPSANGRVPATKMFSMLLHEVAGYWYAHGVIVLFVILAFPFVLVYLSTWKVYNLQRRTQSLAKVPSIVLYVILYIGSGLAFALDPSGCIAAAR